MEDLIEALQIFLKYHKIYANDYIRDYPTNCDDDVLYIRGVPVLKVSEEDRKRLYELGFYPGGIDDEFDSEVGEYIITEDSNVWRSDRYGS